jgi:hypothetical protein
MRRITLNLSPTFIVPDDFTLDQRMDLDERIGRALQDLDGVETVIHRRQADDPVQSGTCRVDGHTFVSPLYWPADRALPDICPEHARQAEQASWEDTFAGPLQALAEAGWEAGIWHTGGGCHSIGVPTPDRGSAGGYFLLGDKDDGPLVHGKVPTTWILGWYDNDGEWLEGFDLEGPDAVALVNEAHGALAARLLGDRIAAEENAEN